MIKFSIDAHAARDLIYSWKNYPGVVILDETMSQFELTDHDSKAEMVGYVAGKSLKYVNMKYAKAVRLSPHHCNVINSVIGHSFIIDC